MRAIRLCRTAALGGHLEVCDHCDFERPAYNSCRNRHCPKCQARDQAAWVDKHVARILPTHYFHVVFTLPAELRDLVHRNRKLLFDLVFETASKTLLDLGKDRLGATLGITAVLHTWTRQMSFHPHLHCIVTGGGLASDGASWVQTKADYLFPYLVLSRLFRGKFLAGLQRLYQQGVLDLGGACQPLLEPDVFQLLKDRLYRMDWVVYAKPPFADPEDVYRYLGRYTHRIAISNGRLEAIDDETVRFKTNYGKTATLSHDEFIRRFLLHVLPQGFHKIRHYGLLASGNLKTKLVHARRLLGVNPAEVNPEPSLTDDWREWMLQLGVDVSRCPHCGVGTMLRRPLTDDISRSPPPARAA